MNKTLLDIEKGTCEAFIDECEKVLETDLNPRTRSEVLQQMNITRSRLAVLDILLTKENENNE